MHALELAILKITFVKVFLMLVCFQGSDHEVKILIPFCMF